MKLSLRPILPSFDRGWSQVWTRCAGPGCDKKVRGAAGNSHPAGIQVGEQWFCSLACFSQGSRAILTRVATEYVVDPPREPRLSLGLALLSKGYLSEDQLRSATVKAQDAGLSVENFLLEQGWVNEKQIAAARGVQWGQPLLGIDPSDKVVEVNLPLSLLRAHWAAPIHFSPERNRLLLGFVNRVELGLLQSIEQIAGYRTEPCFITPTEFNQQIARFRTCADYEEVFSGHPADVPQISGKLADLALEVSGVEARFTRCRSWIWVRIAGNRGTIDAISAIKPESQGVGEEFYSITARLSEALS